MTPSLPHLVVLPIVLPLLAAAIMLMLGDGRRRVGAIVNIVATSAQLVIAIEILRRVDTAGAPQTLGVYLAANWEAPFGIVLVADRLSALMLVLSTGVGLAAAVYASADWSRVGAFFHPLFQIQLMGLAGSFLTGDLFNLFVFFEVMLSASYGLHLHGSGAARVRSGLHYIAINLLASSLFLIGLAMLYGITGTLSMAEIAAKLPMVPEADVGLLHAGVAILAVAFLTKAAIWPLGAWLPATYSAASAPVAALFALMTKVGIYTLLRLWTLMFPSETGAAATTPFGGLVFVYGGIATIAFGVLGLMAWGRLGRIAGFSIIVSSGTLLAAIGVGDVAVTAAALYYLLSASLAASALFLLVELVERARTSVSVSASVDDDDVEPGEDTNLDEKEEALVGRAIPVSLALLGVAFIACTVLVAGLPPLSGFVAKFALLSTLLGSTAADGSSSALGPAIWAVFALLLVAGLAATVSMTRAGIRHFWSGADRAPPRVGMVEGVPILALVMVCVALTIHAESVMRYARATADALHSPAAYIDAVLSTRPIPGPTRPQPDGEGAR